MTDITPLDLAPYQGKHLLVTGSSGYLANNLIEQLKGIDCTITRVARHGKILTLNQGQSHIHDVIGDLNTRDFWMPLLSSVDIVFHFAGQANVTQANLYPIDDIQHSIMPLLQLLETCRYGGYHPHVILASSVSLYGYSEQPFDESTPNQPQTIYDIHKSHAENYLAYYIACGFVTGCCLRLTNVYGPSLHSNKSYQGLINQAIYAAFQHEPIIIHGDGLNERDYLYLEDATQAFLVAGLHASVVNKQTYIIASGQAYSVNQIVDEILAQLHALRGMIPVIERQATSDENRTRFLTNTDRFYQATGWQPRVTIQDGIALTIKAQ